ncbi:MAG: DNA-binding response regulator [Parvularcula sp.]|uniref:response regulator n=1 Tax=Hyphococcus sp. TaxID=2038636 RepID=UPI000C623118|nr:DNA-binding response regulator [Parvularcula sp.]
MTDRAAIRVVIVDDHPIVREGLRTLLGDEQGLEIVGEAGDADEGERLATTLKPDIILMDVALPGRSGIEAAAAIREKGLPSRVILLTSTLGDDLRLQEAIDAEVMGYLLKDVSRGELVWSIESAHRGAPVFHPAVQKQLLRRATGERLPHEKLTPRELDILKSIAKGKSNKVIAYDFNLTEGTVKGYVSVVLSKLGVTDRTQAALYAVKHQLAE